MKEPVSIPGFFLYGETDEYNDSGFVHIESISARSEKESWVIHPHRHGKLFQLVMILDGETEISLDYQTRQVSRNTAVVIPAGTVHGFRFTPGTKGYVLTIAEPLINQSAQSRAVDYLNFVTQTVAIVPFQPDSPFTEVLNRYLSDMLNEFQSVYPGKQYLTEWMVKLILMILYRELETHHDIGDRPRQTDPKFYQFSQLIEAHFRSQLPVSGYAEKLGISLSTLNRLCRKEKGNTAKQLIQERLYIEARRRLLYTQSHIDQVAYALGFDDPAYFSRFFKLQSGLSPKAYRRLNPFETEFSER